MSEDNIHFIFSQLNKTKTQIYIEAICIKENENILFSIISFLPFDSLLSLSKTSKLLHKSISKKLIKKYSLLECITTQNRKLYYMQMIDINKTKNLILKELSEFNIKDNLYRSILLLSEEKKKKKDKVFSKICEEIGRDIARTFYTEKFVNGNGKEMLKNILTALALIRPEIGYCQGMNFIAGALISYLDDEKIAFYIFLSFIDNIELNLLYLKNMPDYSIRVYQLDYYIRKFFPKLSRHLKKNDINLDIFFSKWIFTLFSSYLPFKLLCKVWDVFIIDKWKSIFKFSMAFFFIMQDELLLMDLPQFSQYFRNSLVNKSITFKDIANLYTTFKITNKELNWLRENFFMDQVKNKLIDPETVWESDQDAYINSYRKNIFGHSKEYNKKIIANKVLIENLNKEYNRANEKYEKQRKFCDNLKLKLELLIEMKIGIENLLNNLGIAKSESKEKKKLKGILLSLIKGKKDQMSGIKKQLKNVNKDIEKENKLMLINIQLLDKKRRQLEKINKQREEAKSILVNIFKDSEQEKNAIIKNLSEKLKLSVKFVSTSKY